MKEWVAKLLGGEVQPNLPLPGFFVNPMPYARNDQEVADWLEQVTAQESFVQIGLSAVAEATDDGAQRSALNKFWRQTRNACDHSFGGKCQFVDICWGPSAIADDPVASGLYKLRDVVDHTNGVEVAE